MILLHYFRIAISTFLTVGAGLKKVLLVKYAMGKITFLILMLAFNSTAQQQVSDSSGETVAIHVSKRDTTYLANLAKAMQKIQHTNPEKAKKIALEGALTAENQQLTNSAFIFYKFLGNLSTKQKQANVAIFYLSKSLEYAKINHNPYQTKEVAEKLETAYRKKKLQDSITYFGDLEAAAKEQILHLENDKLVHRLEEELYTEEKEIQMLLQDNKHKEEIIGQQKREEYIIVLCCVLAVIMLYVLFRNFRQKQQLKELQTNKKLEEIADITSHQLRGPVASIMGLVGLFNKENPTDPFNKEIVEHLDKSAKDLDKVIHKIVEKTYMDKDDKEDKEKK
jgi:hypothetical protein